MLPAALIDAVRQALLEHVGPAAADVHAMPVGGGDICRAAKVTAGTRAFFLKWRPDAPPGFFAAEAKGLARLANVHRDTGVGVPGVIAVGDGTGGAPPFLLLKWIARERADDGAAAALGAALARQHLARGPAYGWDADSFLGPLPFPAGWGADWPTYYRDMRLVPLVAQADRRGLLGAERAARLRKLLDRLEEWLAHRPEPALLHGDLWGGNWMVGRGTAPDAAAEARQPRSYLIDPASFYGDPELDLAMTELFGGFPPAFSAAYQRVRPIDPLYPDRRPLYQLYYLLAHLVLFGEAYGAAVDRILRRYVG